MAACYFGLSRFVSRNRIRLTLNYKNKKITDEKYSTYSVRVSCKRNCVLNRFAVLLFLSFRAAWQGQARACIVCEA